MKENSDASLQFCLIKSLFFQRTMNGWTWPMHWYLKHTLKVIELSNKVSMKIKFSVLNWKCLLVYFLHSLLTLACVIFTSFSGDAADGMYFIEDGKVSIRIQQDAGEVEISNLEKGGYFGELALVTHRPRAASAYAVDNVKVACKYCAVR